MAQSLITAILLGVIALTLLSPEHQNTLFAVDVPGSEGPVIEGTPSYEPGAGGRPGENGAGASGSANGPALGFTGPGTGTTAAPGTPGGPLPSHPGTEDDEGDTGTDGPSGPPDDQYGGTLARLSDAVD